MANLENAMRNVSYLSGTGTGTIAGLQISDVGVIVGIVFTVLTYVTYLYFSWRKDKRETMSIARLRDDHTGRTVRKTPKP